jgi:hypothetical protein
MLGMKKTSAVVGAVLAAGLLLTAGSCDESSPTSASRESASRDGSYDSLVAAQPAHGMTYSPTRETINFWIDTWNQPGKLSYVYLQSGEGNLVGYYVLKGLPVSYCAGLTPPQQKISVDGGEYGMQVLGAAPSVDGVYYSGAQCNSFFGEDATTGAYIEYTVGNSQNVLLYDQPLPRQDVQPLGPTTVDAAKSIPQPPTGDGSK